MGHTNLTQYDTGNYAVHPHIRGAYGSSPRRRWGSAVHPHIRGAYYQGATVQRTCGRFIPTYVGHTHFRASARALISVHPHIRGAYYLYKLSVSQVLGSSPHTWGILSQGPHIPQILRFIPTYVGHTRNGGDPDCPLTVHPHIRGAYQRKLSYNATVIRFIPTYVGHTRY